MCITQPWCCKGKPYSQYSSRADRATQLIARVFTCDLRSGALEYGGAPASALAALLQIGQTLSPEEFKVRVVPALSKLFASNDRSVRRSLLESIDTYGPHLSEVCTVKPYCTS